jgi:hypothetical protein
MIKMNSKLTFLGMLCLLTLTALPQQWNGLTYYSNMGTTSGYLMDTSSVNVKTYTFTGGTSYSTHFMPGGNFFRSVQVPGNPLTGGGMSGRMQKLDYNGNILWDYSYYSSTYSTHHDHCVLPNGNVLVICYDVRNSTDLANAGCTSTLTSIRSEKIMEWQPVGTNSVNVVWEWKLWDHTVQNLNSSLSNYQPSIVDHPELMNINYKTTNDWWHMNGIDYNPLLDQIAISSHNMNEWYIIDHSTSTAEAASHSGGVAGKGGDFLYRWGNPLAYQAVSSPSILNVTHDAHWIPEGCPNAGSLSGINNKGVISPSNKTTVDVAPVPRVNYNYTLTPGSAFTPSMYSTRHTSTGYTSNMGSVDEFPNGNKMICLATAGTIYEIDAAGNTLWTKTTSGSCPQSHRYTSCYLTNPAPPQPSITLSGTDLVSSSATSYQWYLNGDLISGATGQTFSPTQNGIYVVKTTDANGCVYMYSKGYQVGTPTGLRSNGLTNTVLEVFPNPSEGVFHLKVALQGNYTVQVYSMNGQLVHSEKNTLLLDLSGLDNGVYFIVAGSDNNVRTAKKITILK